MQNKFDKKNNSTLIKCGIDYAASKQIANTDDDLLSKRIANTDDDLLDAMLYCHKDIINTSKYATQIAFYKSMMNETIIDIPGMIDRVIFNDPATIVIWKDGTKTVVKRTDNDKWDPEKGFCMAIIKKLYGHTSFIKRFTEPKNMDKTQLALDNLANSMKRISKMFEIPIKKANEYQVTMKTMKNERKTYEKSH